MRYSSINLQSRGDLAKLEAAMAAARAKSPEREVTMTRRYPHLSRKSEEARLASWARVDQEVSRLLFNIETFGAQRGDARKLRKLRDALAKAVTQ